MPDQVLQALLVAWDSRAKGCEQAAGREAAGSPIHHRRLAEAEAFRECVSDMRAALAAAVTLRRLGVEL